jgi:uncharacterized protein (TIGR02996 family)
MNEEGFLQQIVDDPANAATTWLVLADWLEERGDPRAELVRLIHDPGFRPDLSSKQRDSRVRELVLSGVRPCLPTFTNSIGMCFVLIPPGKFLMGSPDDEEGRFDFEGPQHEVEISQAFCMSAYQVTQGEYETVMGSNPSHFSAGHGGKESVRGMDTRRFPVESVDWFEAVDFCGKLSELPGEKWRRRIYRLPTEAEWEYACRGGPFLKLTAPFYFVEPAFSLDSSRANFDGNYPYGGGTEGSWLRRTTEVGSYEPNLLGLYDMHGNVDEWCADWIGYYPVASVRNTTGPQSGTHRVLRGGSFFDHGEFCRATSRPGGETPGDRSFDIGFRVVCLLKTKIPDDRNVSEQRIDEVPDRARRRPRPCPF